MHSYTLPFATIIVLQSDIAEVIINEGVEMDENMVDSYHEFLLSHLTPPFSVLVNKTNSYTYDFNAQVKVGTLKEMNAIAVVAYNRISEMSTEALANMFHKDEWHIKIFGNRNEAYEWLLAQQKAL